MTDTYEDILFEVRDGIARITLNRPERLNAWTIPMQRSLKRAIHAAGGDDAVRVIVITGAGRGFCAGADMKLLHTASETGTTSTASGHPATQHESKPQAPQVDPDLATHFPGPFGYLLALPKPVIAAVNGPCVGIGMAFALFCDLRFASEQAFFTTAFAQRGLIAEHGMSWILPRLLGPARALDILFSARRVGGQEAETLGLVNRAWPHDHFIHEVDTYAARLARDVSPRSLAVIKAQLWRALSEDLATAIETADREMLKSFKTEDFKEGIAHFVEKRTPHFTGR